MAIDKISGQTLAAMRRKSAATLPDRPSQRGYTAEDIRQAMVACLLDPRNSLSAELNRIADEANTSINGVVTRLDDIDTRMRLSLLNIPVTEWTDGAPYQAIAWIPGVGFGESEYSKAYSALLIPLNENTRREAQKTELRIQETISFVTGTIELILSRDDHVPAVPLEFVVVSLMTANPNASANTPFKASASFVGVTELPDELMEREVKRVMNAVMSTSYPKISVGVHTIGSYQWGDTDPYHADLLTVDHNDHCIVLLIPLDEDTRRESQRIEVRVSNYSGGESYANIRLECSQYYPSPTLTYECITIELPDPLPANFVPVASIVGVAEISDDFIDREVLAAIRRNPQSIAELLRSYMT